MMQGERVVLARKDPGGWVEFQWTGAEPEGLHDIEIAKLLGAQWEGQELVTYDLNSLNHQFLHLREEFLADPD